MKEILINGVIFFSSIFVQLYTQSFILELIFELKYTKTTRLIITLILAFCMTTSKLLFPINLSFISPLVCLVVSTILLKHYNKERTIFKCILYNLFLMILSAPIEAIGAWLGFKIFSMQANNENIIETIPILLVVNILYIVITLIICLFKKRTNIIFNFNKKSTYINLLVAFLFIAPNIIFYTLNRYDYPLSLLLYNIFANIALVVLTVYNTYKNIKLETTERDLQNSEMHNKSLNELVDSIRLFKHDYNNVVHAIGGYVSTNDMEGLSKYYEGLAKDSKKVNQLENISPDKINEPSIYGIFASKYQTAESKHIEFNFDSMINYQNIDMPVYDFCKILGILLDNAIEAAEESEEKRINITIRESKKSEVQFLSIENTYLNKNIDIEKIYEKNYSTKNRNSGLGLWEVKDIVDRNKNVSLVTNKDDIFFKQELYIKLKG